MPHKITPDLAGCWLAGASNRSADELNRDTIAIAIEYGWNLPHRADDATLLAQIDASWPEGSSWSEGGIDGGCTYTEVLTEMADEAVQYLNTLAPDGFYFTFDDGLYLYSDDEEI